MRQQMLCRHMHPFHPKDRYSTDEGFAAALTAIANVDGWLTQDQARHLWDCARSLPSGSTIVEIGSFHGRSTIVLARARPENVVMIAIDPHAGGERLPQTSRSEPDEGKQDFVTFHVNLRRAGVQSRVRHVRLPSLEALQAVGEMVDLLFIDGAHRYKAVRADIDCWGARVPLGGTMLVHDSFNAIGVTAAQLRTLLVSGDWRYCGRSGSLAEYRREVLSFRSSLASARRQLGQLCYFARNLVIKAALAARMRWLAGLLGHRIDGWPH